MASATEGRKRKSNFDIPPEAMPAQSTQRVNLSEIIASFGLVHDQQPIGTASVLPPAFKLRLEKAMQKNLSYIQKLDSGILATQHSTSIGLSKQPRKSAAESVHSAMRAGIGAPTGVPPAVTERKCAVYVDGLPLDISESEIDILFSKIGAIRKIKIYQNSAGLPKGDALVTYSKPESVAVACIQLNKLDIGDGFVLKVTPAENYTPKCTGDHSSKDLAETATSYLSTVSRPGVGTLAMTKTVPINMIPPEFELPKYPVVIIFNMFSQHDMLQGGADFLSELEADMLMECCQIGKVKRIIAGHPSLPEGTVSVTFEDVHAATVCSVRMKGRWFDGRQLETQLLLPSMLSDSSSIAHPDVSISDTSLSGTANESNAVSMLNQYSRPEEEEGKPGEEFISAELAIEVEAVEDFLNSLL